MEQVLQELSRNRFKSAADDDMPATAGSPWLEGGWVETATSAHRSLRFEGVIDPIVIRQQSGDVIGCSLWPSAVVLSRFVWRTCRQIKPLRVLELGCGCGLVSICLSMAGHDVLATDKSAVLPTLNANLDAFHASTASDGCLKVRSAAFDWTGVAADAKVNSATWPSLLTDFDFDLVVLSDCLYSTAAVGPLISALSALIERRAEAKLESVNLQVLIANEQRSALDEFLAAAGKHPTLGSSLVLKNVHLPLADLSVSLGWEVPVRCLLLGWGAQGPLDLIDKMFRSTSTFRKLEKK